MSKFLFGIVITILLLLAAAGVANGQSSNYVAPVLTIKNFRNDATGQYVQVSTSFEKGYPQEIAVQPQDTTAAQKWVVKSYRNIPVTVNGEHQIRSTIQVVNEDKDAAVITAWWVPNKFAPDKTAFSGSWSEFSIKYQVAPIMGGLPEAVFRSVNSPIGE